MILCFGPRYISNSQAQLTNKTQDSISIQVAGNGSHGADLFVDPDTNQIYATYIKTQNES